METSRKRSSSGEIFSFPSTPTQESQDSDFEFGCLTPDSPSQDPSRNSPADRLFFNGRLLPHSFPLHQPQSGTLLLSPDNISRATSRTSSVSSRDSLMSSRCNSTNSRSSTSSSSSSSTARTSLSSDNSERRFLYYHHHKKAQCRATMAASKMVTAQLYGPSKRWQHLTPAPVSKPEAPRKQKRQQGNQKEEEKKGVCRRIFMAFLFACRECHAMEPSPKDIHDGVVKKANMKL